MSNTVCARDYNTWCDLIGRMPIHTTSSLFTAENPFRDFTLFLREADEAQQEYEL
jgi:hypothetical protein